MCVKSFGQIQSEVDRLVRVWDANPTFQLGDVSLESLQALIESFKDERSAVEDLHMQLTKLVIDSNQKAARLKEIAARGRWGIRAHFGADSAQYEEVGGTRPSRRSRKVNIEEQEAAAS